MGGSRYEVTGSNDVLLPGVYESDGHVDLKRHDQQGNYLEGLVVRELWSGRDYLCQFLTGDILLIHCMWIGVSYRCPNDWLLMSPREGSCVAWLRREYRGQEVVRHRVDWSAVSSVVPAGIPATVIGVVRYESTEYGLVVQEREDLPAGGKFVIPSREVVYGKLSLSKESVAYRWGGGVYRPVRGLLAPDVVERAWWKVRTSVVGV